MLTNLLKNHLMLLAPDDGTNVPNTPPVEEPKKASGKVWTDEYVTGLREEAKTYRLGKKAVESKLRSLLGLKDDDVIDDNAIATYQLSQQQLVSNAMVKANERLISAEIKTLEGYDSKLVERLLDKSKIEIKEDGSIIGLKDAVEALAVEFPLIKKAQEVPATPPANPGQTTPPTELEQMEQDYSKALKAGNLPEAIALKNKIFEARKQNK